jgi:hypothetical protein
VGDDVAWCPFICASGFLRIWFGEGDQVKLEPEDELRLLHRCAVGDELHRCGAVDELTLLHSCLSGDE